MATSSSPEEDDGAQPQEAENEEEDEEVIEEEVADEEVEEIEEEVVEEEEEEEVEEIVEEEEEGAEEEEEEEEGNKIEEGEGEEIQEDDNEGPVDSSDSSVAAHVDPSDASQEIRLEGNNVNDDLICSTLKKSEVMLEPQVQLKDNGCSKLVPAHIKEFISKENKLSEFSLENKNVGVLSEKGVSSGGFEICTNNSGEADDGLQTHVIDSTSNAKSSCFSANDFHLECQIRGGSSNINLRNTDIQHSRKEMDHVDMQTSTNSTDEMKRTITSSHTPQQRPRSLTPDAEFDDRIKRPAIICDFFARGWCIKGNSCRFLHQKIGVDSNNTVQLNKRDPDVLVVNEENENSGLGTQVGRLRSSTSVERPYTDCSPNSKPPIPSERLLPEELEVSQQQDPFLDKQRQRNDLFSDGYNMRTLQGDCSKFDITPTRGFGTASLHEKSPNVNTRDDRQSYSEELVSGKYPFAGKTMLQETQKGDSSHVDEPFASRASPFSIKNNSIPQSGYLSSGLLISSSIYGNDKGVLGSSILGSSSYMSFNNLPTTSMSTTDHKLSYPGTAISNPLISRNSSSEKLLGVDKGYFSSRSALLPQGSLPHYTVNETESLPVHNMPADSVGSKSQSYSYNWEPSVRFRSSFCCPLVSISSPRNQYDPLRDSIDPPVGGNGFFQTSCQSTTLGSASVQQLKTDLVSTILSRNSSYIGAGPAHSLVGSHDSSLGKNLQKQEVGENATEAGSTGTSVACEENRSYIPKEEKSLSPVFVDDTAEVKDLNVDGSSKHHVNKGRHNKDSKTVKLFHSALISFVKELIKPSWREGHLSKDAHKKIVKKVVDKVLKSLRSHQIPHTTESSERYLSSSQSKLAKLVEGYIEKYGNPKT